MLKSVATTGGQEWTWLNAADPIYDNDDTPKKAGLWDIHMIDEDIGWAVGYDGAIERTTNGGIDWSLPGGCSLPEEITDAADLYDIHYFDATHGIICADWGRVYLTNPSTGCWEDPLLLEDAIAECPVFQGHNIELWSMSFDDPTNYESGIWIFGGVGFNNGYIFRYPGHATWGAGTWTQSRCYQFVEPETGESPVCGLATQYAGAILGSSIPKVLSVGYAAQFFRFASGTANFDPCECTEDLGDCPSPGATWLETIPPNPDLHPPAGTSFYPLPPFLHVDRLSATTACMTGRFGRIVLYDDNSGSPSLTDVGTTSFPLRLSDGDFIDDGDDDTGCVIGQFNIIKRTTDFGASWSDVTPSGSYDDNAQGWGLDLSTTGQYGIAVGSAGFTASSTNYGSTWTETTPSPAPSDLYAVSFVPSSTWAYAVGASGTVLKSENAGSTWSAAATVPDAGATLFGVSFVSTTTGYVVGTNTAGTGAVAYKTTNSGANWSNVSISTPPNVPTMFRDVETWGDGSSAVAVGSRGAVYEGSSSTLTAVSLSPVPAIVEALFDVQVLYTVGPPSAVDLRIGGDRGMVLFRDSGTWSAPKSQTSETLYRVVFPSLDFGYGIGRQGLILKYE